MFTLTIHNILDYKVPTIDKGVTFNLGKTRILEGAKRQAIKELRGDLQDKRPKKIAHITGPDIDSWWFMGVSERVTYRGAQVLYVDRSLILCQHEVSIPVIQEQA